MNFRLDPLDPSVFREATAWILRRLYPSTCVLCGARGLGELDLCAACLADLPTNRHCCRRCALPLSAELPADALCGGCQHRLPPYAVCHTAFRYEGPIPFLLVGAKFNARLNLVRLLGQCLAGALRERAVAMPELILPVPLHAQRLRERGYNQSFEIARTVGRELSLPVDAHSCARILATTPQSRLTQEARRRNVRGAFRILRPPGVERVAILDDVITTGSTVSELAKVLLQSGIERVDVWAVAYAP